MSDIQPMVRHPGFVCADDVSSAGHDAAVAAAVRAVAQDEWTLAGIGFRIERKTATESALHSSRVAKEYPWTPGVSTPLSGR